jgi:hypothetical protein
MFDALRQIGGADAAGVAAQIMQTTTNPAEVAVLAGDLEAMAPGQYRETALAAARDGLARTPPDSFLIDSSPYFEVLQKFGGAESVATLQQAAARWNYYAPMALASLPDGAGLSTLAIMAQNIDGSSSGSSRFALRMLAQLSAQNPDAAQALLNQVSTGQIPESAWQGIAAALNGEQAYYGDSYLNNTPPADGTDRKTYHIASNDQNYQTLNVSGGWTQSQVQQQLNYINQLSAANPIASQRQTWPVASRFCRKLGGCHRLPPYCLCSR